MLTKIREFLSEEQRLREFLVDRARARRRLCVLREDA
jgi:hypothetical protein